MSDDFFFVCVSANISVTAGMRVCFALTHRGNPIR